MKKRFVLALGIVLVVTAAAGAHLMEAWRIDYARNAKSIELELAPDGEFKRADYRIDVGDVPATIREAFEDAFQGVAAPTRAAKRWHRNRLHFLLTGMVGQTEVEALIHLEPRVVQTKKQIKSGPAFDQVRDRVLASQWASTLTKILEIRNASGQIEGYHAWGRDAQGRSHRFEFPAGIGDPSDIYYETVAEIEIPR